MTARRPLRTIENVAPAGIDGIAPEELADHIEQHRARLAAMVEQHYAEPRRRFEETLARKGLAGIPEVRTITAFLARPPADLLAAYLESQDHAAKWRRLTEEAYAAAGQPIPAAYTAPRPARSFLIAREAPIEAMAARPTRGSEVDVTWREVYPADQLHAASGAPTAGPEFTWRVRTDGEGGWGVVVTIDLVWGDLRNDLGGREVLFFIEDPVISAYLLSPEYQARAAGE